MTCAGCQRDLEVGDQYIVGTASEYLRQDVSSEVGGLLAEILGGRPDSKIVYCEDCTQAGGDFMLSTYYGDEDA